jgi:hypothetical protein
MFPSGGTPTLDGCLRQMGRLSIAAHTWEEVVVVGLGVHRRSCRSIGGALGGGAVHYDVLGAENACGWCLGLPPLPPEGVGRRQRGGLLVCFGKMAVVCHWIPLTP